MEIMWPLLKFIVIVAVVMTSIFYIQFRPESENGEVFYTSKLSFNKTLDKKAKHFYIQKMSWLKIYMNIILPIATISSLWDIIILVIDGMPGMAWRFVLRILYVVFAISITCFIRFIDKLSYNINIAWNVFFAVYNALMIFDVIYGIINLVVYGSLAALNILYFYKRRELFLLSAKQIRRKYSLDEE